MTGGTASREGRGADRNVNCFIAFRVFFNARFYYPVIAVLFLDFGLTMQQYALLNAAWAVSIVLLEVPSGALADQMGRKRLVVLAAVLMLIEMLVLCLAPAGASALLFVLFLINRFLSGAAEACASGADEALAYDALAAEGRRNEWPKVLDRLIRWQSAAFVIAMVVGAAVYDPALMRSLAVEVGWDVQVTQATTLRFPIYLTLLMALAALGSALAMREPPHATKAGAASNWATTWEAGVWILHTRSALLVILAGVCCDSVIRLVLTVSSEYYRLIRVPEFTFGFLGAAFSAIGFVTAPIAKRLVGRRSPRFNFGVLAALIWAGLFGVSLALPISGVLFILLLGMGMVLLNFFLSHYLNEMVDSRMRATVLSFKGLAMNIAFGGVSLFFALLLRALKEPGGGGPFAEALRWLPWYFAATLAAVGTVRAAFSFGHSAPKLR